MHRSNILCRITGVLRTSCSHRHQHTNTQATIIDGKKIANEILKNLKAEVEDIVKAGKRAPCLTAILVGDNAASATYVRNKMVAAKKVGISSDTIRLPTETSQDKLLEEVNKLNNDEKVDGIIVQLPLPKHIDEQKVFNSVLRTKDVDGFSASNFGLFSLNMCALAPATPLAVHELILRTGIETKGKNAVVCGRSKNVGLPIAMLLHSDTHGDILGMDATTTICHRFTPPDQLTHYLQNADIVVSAVGIPNLIQAHMVKKGACIIDVGISHVKDPSANQFKLVGDVDFENVSKVAGFITPVPGGVGPMTVVMLMKNTIIASRLNCS
nr:PREDICTED: bifunctional methylenetetrahydrofolate dehydrogenase/cyclohydrolase, mitochondrial [Bemisia tabaci]